MDRLDTTPNRWNERPWYNRVFAAVVIWTSLALALLEVSVPNGVGLFFIVLIGIVTPFRFLVGMLLLAFGVLVAAPLELLALTPLGGIAVAGMILLGIAMLWWDWKTARNRWPGLVPAPEPTSPLTPTPEGQRKLAGAIGVWFGAILGAILIVVYLVFGPFNSR